MTHRVGVDSRFRGNDGNGRLERAGSPGVPRATAQTGPLGVARFRGHGDSWRPIRAPSFPRERASTSNDESRDLPFTAGIRSRGLLSPGTERPPIPDGIGANRHDCQRRTLSRREVVQPFSRRGEGRTLGDMTESVSVPLWIALIGGALALWALMERLLIPSVRWFFRQQSQPRHQASSTRGCNCRCRPFTRPGARFSSTA